jgi:hypothetical protein
MSRGGHCARRARREDSGYALLMVIFMVASMLLLAAVAAPRVLTEGRREKEAEMVWRGKQYTRAVRLYYQKNGRYPQTLEDLSKPNATGAHYLRKSYKDPTNAVDGSWRLIYVAPSGQLIGSVNYFSLQDMAAKLGLGIPAGGSSSPLLAQLANVIGAAPSGVAAGQQGTQAAPGGAPQSGQPGQAPAPGQLAQPAQPGQDSSQSSGFGSGFGQPAQPGQLQPVDGPVLGGSIIGVGGKVKKDSLEIYQGANTYAKWEFIWNPLTTVGGTGQLTSTGVVGGAPSATGAAPATGTFGLPGAAGTGMGAGGLPPAPAPAPTQPNPQQ